MNRLPEPVHAPLAEVQAVHGKYGYRREGTDKWRFFDTPVDRLLGFMCEELGMEKRGGIFNIGQSCQFTSAMLSRIRHHVVNNHGTKLARVSDGAYYRFHHYTGIPLEELRRLMAEADEFPIHKNARSKQA